MRPEHPTECVPEVSVTAVMWPGRKTEHSPPPGTQVNEWSYTTAPPIRPQAVHGETFTFTLIIIIIIITLFIDVVSSQRNDLGSIGKRQVQKKTK